MSEAAINSEFKLLENHLKIDVIRNSEISKV